MSEISKQLFFDHAPDVLCVLDGSGVIEEVNPQWEIQLGRKSEEVLQKPFTGFVVEDDKAYTINFISGAFKGELTEGEIRMAGTEDRIRWFSWKMVVLPGQQSLLCFGRDITAQKEFEQELDERRRRYTLATSAAGVGIWDWQIVDNTVYYSSVWKRQLGYKPEELPNEFETWQKLLHPDDYEMAQHKLFTYVDHPEGIFEMEFRMRHKDGSYRWIYSRAASLKNADQRAYRMLGIHRDITKEKALREELLVLQRAVYQSAAPILITDIEGNIQFVNPKYCQLTGFLTQEITGRNPRIFKSGKHSKKFYTQLWNTILDGREWSGRLTNKRKDGSLFIEQVVIAPVLNPEGEISHFIKVSEDITEQIKLQKELEAAKNRAEVANIYKNNFLANMSHEIRTPMNGIIGFAELLKEPDLEDEERDRYIQIINDNCNVLLNLVDDIIDVSKMEANELRLQTTRFSLKKMLTELREFYLTYRSHAHREVVDIQLNVPEQFHQDVIETDQYRLRQIISNLINNALKFTHHGYIEFGYELMNFETLQFYVKDTGIGIPKEKQRVIFERFRQSDESLTRKYGGAGLGLSICEGLVGLLGGNIWLESEIDQGSIFYFRIPYRPVDKPTNGSKPVIQPVPGTIQLKGVKILVVEDIDYNYEYLYEVLKNTGARITWARDGKETLRLLKKKETDLVLLDLRLPDMNGFDIAADIKKQFPVLPVIAQTAYVASEDIEKFVAVGYPDYVIKPIRRKELFGAIGKYFAIT